MTMLIMKKNTTRVVEVSQRGSVWYLQREEEVENVLNWKEVEGDRENDRLISTEEK